MTAKATALPERRVVLNQGVFRRTYKPIAVYREETTENLLGIDILAPHDLSVMLS